MKTKLLFISLLLAATSSLFAQDAVETLKFKEKVHDFGQIKEEGGKVTTTFEFTNTSKKPITLTNVTASCGCTTPEWTKEPVAPKKKGFINVTYNPAGRPGNFTKSITIKFTEVGNKTAQVAILNIKGEVIPKPKDKQ